MKYLLLVLLVFVIVVVGCGENKKDVLKVTSGKLIVIEDSIGIHQEVSVVDGKYRLHTFYKENQRQICLHGRVAWFSGDEEYSYCNYITDNFENIKAVKNVVYLIAKAAMDSLKELQLKQKAMEDSAKVLESIPILILGKDSFTEASYGGPMISLPYKKPTQ